MPSKTITVTNGDGSTKTITIPDRSRFAGVRDISRSSKLDDNTTSIQVTSSSHPEFNGIYTTTSAGADSTWNQQGGNSVISVWSFNASDGYGYEYILEDGSDGDPQYLLSNNAGFTDRPWKANLGSSITITPVTETLTVDRTAPVITSDRKGESRPLLSKVVGGAAAAYSLRDLNDKAGNNKVVRVRRGSDNNERDFLAKEVSNGTLTDWVNVGKNYIGYARFQDSTTANVNLTSSFTLEATNNWSIKFGYIGGSTPAGLFGSSGNSNIGFWFGNPTAVGITDDNGYFSSLNFSSATSLKIGQHHEIEFFNTPAEGVRVTVDGITMLSLPKIYGDITLNKVGISRGRDGERVIENVRIDLNGDGTLDYSYAGDGNQASNWTDRVGSNNGTPTAQVLTYNNEFTDGFVPTSYDQSGNDNDIVRLTASNQPKIVDAGVLVSGGIDFDGVDDSFTLTSGLTIDPSTSGFSSFIVTKFDKAATGSAQVLLRNNNSNPKHSISFNTSGTFRYNLNDGTNNIFADTGSDYGDNSLNLFSTIITGQSATGLTHFVNGSQDGQFDTSLIGDTGSTADTISWAAFPFGGVVQEMIFYPSDQSANRPAIEANINNQYDIY